MSSLSIETSSELPQRKKDLVVIGSSAGGIEALSTLVATLPGDFPAPIVIAQHLDPNHSSNLGSILARQTSLAVVEVEQESKLEAGTIYIIPPAHHVAIFDGHVATEDGGADRPRPSINLLLTSAAEVYEERLYVVILTGMGSDGSAGAVTAKRLGGTILIQNPSTARYSSMPSALPPTIVDFKADIEQMGSLLYDLLTGAKNVRDNVPHDDVLEQILSEISQYTTIDFRSYKTSSLLRRLERRIVALNIPSLKDYVEYLQTHVDEVGQLVDFLLINVTEFFRDAEAYQFLKTETLPTLIARKREEDKRLRIWCAGCATGEEPYSIAMLLIELLDGEIPDWSIRIFATDLNEASITFARQGLYTEPLLQNVPESYRQRFFERLDGNYRIAQSIRSMVTFGVHDLSRSGPFPRIDLISCRNVLIYFSTELQGVVLSNFAFALQPDGYLFLGKAETVRPSPNTFELINKTWKIYQCTGTSRWPLRQSGILPAASHDRSLNLPVARLNTIENAKGRQNEVTQLRWMNDLLLQFLPMGIVVIDRNYRLIVANSAVRRLLGLHESGQGMDFLHAVRGIPYEIVRAAIDKSFREKASVVLSELELSPRFGGTGRFISFTISPFQGDAGNQELAAISLADITETVQMRRQFEESQVVQEQLVKDLSAANKDLSEMNRQLIDTNEELRVSNEDLMLTQEELQASVEEYETTNEELQASNEELETTNEETQAMNEELHTTNEELRTRTQELQELTVILISQRERLQEMSFQLINTNEIERQSIARELHDQIGQELTAIHLLLGTYALSEDELQLEQVSALVKELIERVRDIALNLRPSLLDDLGLLAALNWYFQRYTEQTQIRVDFQPQGVDRRFALELELTAYRIIQECLTNVARHAHVQQVSVALWVDNSLLNIRVEDNGIGFDTDLQTHTFGLDGMRERARLFSAELSIRSTLGQGTRINVGLPIQPEIDVRTPK